MGKIRVKALGDEAVEKEQAIEAKKKSEARKVEKAAIAATESSVETTPVEATPEVAPTTSKQKKDKFKESKRTRSTSYAEKAELVDSSKLYSLNDAITLLPSLKRAKFDETVELHFTTLETGVSGSVTLPHGTGKVTRVKIADGSDQTSLETLIKAIESGTIDFDILVATPDAMPKLARAARVLGPRGLMPNPKNGTVTTKPEEVAKKYKGGQINFKTEAKAPLIHIAIGKVSFGDTKIKENAKAVISLIDRKQIKNATLKSTMSPAIHLDVSSL
jgi:large subunit ribosomal protein L1